MDIAVNKMTYNIKKNNKFMVNNKMVDIAGLQRYHENLKNVLNTKETAGAADAALAAAKEYADSLAVNYDASGAAATAEQNAKSYADGLAVNYDASGAADAALESAKSYADGLVDGKFDEVGAADAALAAAKEDAAEKYQVKGDYEEAGAADAALAAAKEDAAEKYQVKGDYEEAGAAAQALDAAKEYVDGLVDPVVADVEALKAIDHDKLASDAAATAVATVLDGAPEAFDTLKEVADWIANNETAADAAALVTRVTALEAIDHEAYKTADEGVLADAQAYADGLAGNYDDKGAAAQALADAKAYADGLAGNYDAAGTAETKAAAALEAAKTYVDGKGYLVADDLQFATDAEVDALFA